MPAIVKLPNGTDTALLRDIGQVSERMRRPVVNALPATGMDGLGMGDLLVIFDNLIICMVSDWSLHDEQGAKLPITVDSLLDQPGDVVDALRGAVQPFLTQIMPSFKVTTDKASPTGASNDSDSQSVEATPMASTVTPQPDGASTSSASSSDVPPTS